MMLLVLVVTLAILPNSECEIFTSMADMERMVMSEKYMVGQLKRYVEAEEEKLNSVKSFMTRLNDILNHVNATKDVSTYLGNPVNSYLMLKRFNVDWKNLERTLGEDVAENLTSVMENLKNQLPGKEDQLGAVDALLRLQTVYKLSARSMINGFIPGMGKLFRHPLTHLDAFDIGVRAYNKAKYKLSVDWLEVVLNGISEGKKVDNIDPYDVYDYLSYAYYKIGELGKAHRFTQSLAAAFPSEERHAINIKFYKDEMRTVDAVRGEVGNELTGDEEFSIPAQKNPNIAAEMRRRYETRKKYEKLCRGESRPLTRREKRKLLCWYRRTNPILRLKPQKVERVWVKPEVLLFHDILTDSQVQFIKETSQPRFQRAVIQDPLTDELKIADYRISKSAWLHPKKYPELIPLAKRAEAATKLDILDSAEQLQIADYGIAGQYEPHFDHATGDEDVFTDLGMGNRIATLLFYLTDVEAGGATVFVHAGATLYPVKNGAVFWHNLKRSGASDWWTKHAGCPVLAGHKWISNWWIHEYGQEFRRPCALNKDW